ncbi:histidinol-phosphate aminotransferase family protein [Catenuloplanes japonicus]|uniref:histidinol-phosphate aminotransferase family protein n=1 Tax=Catenuloplanes japonicus TaxID=33876 RepID=UPI000525047F|nr:aminotransferase class I/II-fold pyridoxal phosphate-dependent enzyme [Catenuloplanes japonicus]
MTNQRVELREGVPGDREWIYRLRHRVYGAELGQHETNAAGELRDALDALGLVYLVAVRGGVPAGFVSITPPWVGRWSLDKYVTRAELPVLDEHDTFEVRLLTVTPEERGTSIAALLMYAATRWVESRGARRVVGMGRTGLTAMYRSIGLHPVGRRVRSGRVDYEIMSGALDQANARAFRQVDRLDLDWRLDMPPAREHDGCEHGGASFRAIGTDLSGVHRRDSVVTADVLDAWFDPAPDVVTALTTDAGWLARTSPPVASDGVQHEVAFRRGVPATTVSLGAGSSDLIFRAFREWLRPESRVLLVEPSYGEYAHVTARVVGCVVDRFAVHRRDGWEIDVDRLIARAGAYDLVVLVNPNNPTGRHLPLAEVRRIAAALPSRTRLWVDEAYIGYVGLDESAVPLVGEFPQVAVCTSLSKMYALSGARAAYLIADPASTAALRRWTPPWVLGMPAQAAAIHALGSPEYYATQWERTHELRAGLAAALRTLPGIGEVDESVANYLLVTLPADGPGAARVVGHCRRYDVYLRDLSPMSALFEGRTFRIAVKDARQNERIVGALEKALAG